MSSQKRERFPSSQKWYQGKNSDFSSRKGGGISRFYNTRLLLACPHTKQLVRARKVLDHSLARKIIVSQQRARRHETSRANLINGKNRQIEKSYTAISRILGRRFMTFGLYRQSFLKLFRGNGRELLKECSQFFYKIQRDDRQEKFSSHVNWDFQTKLRDEAYPPRWSFDISKPT
jgi:hypothetical protein